MAPESTSTLVIPLAGFWPYATDAAVQRLDGVAVLDLRASGLAAQALIKVVVKEARRVGAPSVVTLLPERYEPDDVRIAWSESDVPDDVRLGMVCTAVAADQVLDGLANDNPVCSVDPYTHALDDRRIADLIARQIEQADAVIVIGRPEGDEDWESEQLRTLLRRLAPWATVRDELTAEIHRPTPHRTPLMPAIRGLSGHAVGIHEPMAVDGVVSCVFRQKRPFHPARLHTALERITGRVVRSRGHFWLASRPDMVLSWESASVLRIEGAGGWLADLPDSSWNEVHPERRIAATLDWDHYYGDRHHQLAFIGIDLDAEDLDRTLTACLLTDEELADGFDAWRGLPDPFAFHPH
ncbi:cobalamin biosynthesis protein CobW [Actinoplanes sp. OR16]|uniref:GTP-binding protein n=1 Tax=Actinoplanes sp. OR16 TaxID=946334 RepID=UPI000F70731F|nr:GTP-binding protein [Actinoplanes sp. OR16]BBH68001.1 cobalamin biosynthesis protein CobW [Actinoplanes sp. OR16]